MGDERELETAGGAAIPILIPHDPTRMASWAEDIFPEEDTAKILLNLCFRWYLVEMIHIGHCTEFVPTDLEYPVKFY